MYNVHNGDNHSGVRLLFNFQDKNRINRGPVYTITFEHVYLKLKTSE